MHTVGLCDFLLRLRNGEKMVVALQDRRNRQSDAAEKAKPTAEETSRAGMLHLPPTTPDHDAP